jgi:hypothetical protein
MNQTQTGTAPIKREAAVGARYLRYAHVAFVGCVMAASRFAFGQTAAPPVSMGGASGTALDGALKDGIVIGMAVVMFVGLLIVIKTLRVQKWSLATALSEEASLPEGTPTPAAGQSPPMVASSSRLIALIGMIVLGTFFIAIGFYVVLQLYSGQPVDKANAAWGFFASGATLFLPYGANKLSSAFQIK